MEMIIQPTRETRTESDRAVTGRQYPHSGVGEDFLPRRMGPLTKTKNWSEGATSTITPRATNAPLSTVTLNSTLNIYHLTKALHFQLIARLVIGSHGANAVQLATVEPRREHEMLSKKLWTRETLVRILRKQKCATLNNVKVPFLFSNFSFYRTQVSWSDLCVWMSLSEWVSETKYKLNWCDSGWWRYQLNTNW